MRSIYLILLITCGDILGFNFKNNACRDINHYSTRGFRSDCYYDPDVWADFGEIAENHGYEHEAHEIQNQDGYFLTVFRILPKTGNLEQSQPIFLCHGTSANALYWVVAGNSSLPFRLADMGHDVWLGNLRATQYSKRHIKYQPHEEKYWQYALDALAGDDIPTQLGLVNAKTGKKSIYIGHSLGTTLAFMFASGYPARSQQLMKGMIALCPAVYFRGVKRLIEQARKSKSISEITKSLKIWSAPTSLRIRGMIYTYCGLNPKSCIAKAEKTFGPLSQPFRAELLLNSYSKVPDAVGLYQLFQYSQMINSDGFHKFDYGPVLNLRHYGQETPPHYNLTKIKLRTTMFYGESDLISTKKNAMRIYDELGSSEKELQVIPKGRPGIKFNHIDFVLAHNLEEYLYKDIFEVINKWKSLN